MLREKEEEVKEIDQEEGREQFRKIVEDKKGRFCYVDKYEG